ncbi:MAG: hypothetical protein COY75_04060 [Nitrospirae bacterium CG_4_10_14_0_8_um_filter_41_23]|nr:MAG: hypothetical protein COY75_04060 [Nitrospirae bacterium CG_4_10_14_0_8_um_filter_41_23]
MADKLETKHGVTTSEAENIFTKKPLFNSRNWYTFTFPLTKGHVKGEDLYRALGQTDSGRYLTVFFIYKETHEALVISARDMTDKERKNCAKRKR